MVAIIADQPSEFLKIQKKDNMSTGLEKLLSFFGIKSPPKVDVISASRKDHYYIYPVSKKNERTGHTICVLVRDGKIFHGITLCSKKDQFSYVKGRQLAKSRAIEAYNRHLARLG